MMNTCRAYTKKRIPCKNNALEGSHLCSFHEGLFEDFPPVKITALMCPYCDQPLGRAAKFCKTCKNSFLICPFCDEPLRKDDKSCSFCKENLAPVIPKHDKLYYYGMLLDISNGIVERAKAIDKSYGLFMVAIFFFILFIFTISFIDIFHLMIY